MTSVPEQLTEKSQLPKTSEPAARAFGLAGINSLEEMTKYSEKDLLKLHGVGPKAIRILKEEMAKKGLRFAE
jgi:DNA-directed RNA polymerase alpha subunit